jgi:hypothetical protein
VQQQGGTRKRLLLDDEDPKMAAFDELEVQVGIGDVHPYACKVSCLVVTCLSVAVSSIIAKILQHHCSQSGSVVLAVAAAVIQQQPLVCWMVYNPGWQR